MFSADIDNLMVLVPALPLLATLVTALFGKRVLGRHSHWPAVVAVGLAFLCSVLLLLKVNAGAFGVGGGSTSVTIGFEHVRPALWTWIDLDDAMIPAGEAPDVAQARASSSLDLAVTLRADPLSSIMLSMVLFVSTLVVIYSIGYMDDDPGYWRFFTYVSLFVFSMTMLVSVSNFLLLYVFWEAVGVCSYLLIGFWFQKPEAAAAGKKAFLVNRIGDFGFAIGVFLLWTTYGTLNFHDTIAADGSKIAGILGQLRLADPSLYVGGALGLGIAMCLFIGACGKSAQWPLHVWLPDAMEGPTPVSALIHAATMVTAGVYLVTRCTPLFLVESSVFSASPAHEAPMVVATIGGITALLASLIAVTQTDLKRVLAYSTVSQLGYMFLGLGVGTLTGITSGMFHLFTHAFFKALLFLGAGSVMHAMHHVIDMRRFSGLRHIMPWTHATFWFGGLALAGVFPFAGFWSKDMILAALRDQAHGQFGLYMALFYISVFAAFLTAFYTFRALFLTFFGPLVVPEEAGHHAHESPSVMTFPLVILAFCALFVGAYFELSGSFASFLAATPSLAYNGLAHAEHHEFHFDVAVLSTIVALSGVGLAAFLYLGDRSEVDVLARLMRTVGAYQLSYGKFFFDQIYAVTIVWPLRLIASLASFVDRWIIDGLVNLVGLLPRGLGAGLRALQTGMVQSYALAMMLGLLVLIGTLLVWDAGLPGR